MSTRINTNTTAAEAAYHLSINSANVSKNIERLSSGLRINSAADDASGLVISESLRAQSAGLQQASRNTNDAINVVKTAEGALNEVHSLLINIRSLVVHAANVGANDTAARTADQKAIAQAVNSIDRIASTTQFNNKNLLDGSASATAAAVPITGASPLIFQVGANGGQTVKVDIKSAHSADVGAASAYTKSDGTAGTLTGASLSQLGGSGTPTLDVAAATDLTGDNAQKALAIVDQAIKDVSNTRGGLGAIQSSELESNVRSLAVAQQNTDASESTIRDTDLSSEIVNFTKNQILVQAGTSALAQANQAPQAILKLLQ